MSDTSAAHDGSVPKTPESEDQKKEPESVEINGVYKLSEPVDWNGEIINEITFDFRRIKGKQLKGASTQFRQTIKERQGIDRFDERYHEIVGGLAIQRPVAFLLDMSGPDYLEVLNRALIFLQAPASVTMKKEQTVSLEPSLT